MWGDGLVDGPVSARHRGLRERERKLRLYSGIVVELVALCPRR